jgi:hypothetical protein
LKHRRRGVVGLLGVILALVLVAGLAGCVKFTAGHPFAEEPPQDTPSATVQKFFNAMETKNFDDYIAVSPPGFRIDPATGQPISTEDMDALRDAWTTTDTANPHYWKAEFMDLQFIETENDGTNAVVEVNGGLIQYTGKEPFGTSEIKVDNYKDKPGRINLKKINDKWYITGGGEPNGSDNWETPPATSP